jgi:hypothetical protein
MDQYMHMHALYGQSQGSDMNTDYFYSESAFRNWLRIEFEEEKYISEVKLLEQIRVQNDSRLPRRKILYW